MAQKHVGRLLKRLEDPRLLQDAIPKTDDLFEQEPPDPKDPLFSLDNVIVAPHAICWTDECFLENGRSACQSILDVAAGREPRHIVNRAVLESPRLNAKLARYRERAEGR